VIPLQKANAIAQAPSAENAATWQDRNMLKFQRLSGIIKEKKVQSFKRSIYENITPLFLKKVKDNLKKQVCLNVLII